MKRIPFLLVLMLLLAACTRQDKHLTDLRCEGLPEPMGIDNGKPHFSWEIVSDKLFEQVAYEIEVASDKVLLENGEADLWKSGRVKSEQQVMVPYCGKELMTRKLAYWRVKVYSKEACYGWSRTARFSTGIIGRETMMGEYIGMGFGEETAITISRNNRKYNHKNKSTHEKIS